MSPILKSSVPRRRALTAAVVGLAGALSVTATAQAKTVTVTQSRSGGSVTLHKGDRLVVKVAENPSTGYGWKTISKPSFLKLLSSKYVATPVPAGTVGGGGKRTFTYSALRKGTGTLKLLYTRSFDSTGATPFRLKVTVK